MWHFGRRSAPCTTSIALPAALPPRARSCCANWSSGSLADEADALMPPFAPKPPLFGNYDTIWEKQMDLPDSTPWMRKHRMSLPTKPNNDGDNIIEFLIQGDLEKLTPEQRAEY